MSRRVPLIAALVPLLAASAWAGQGAAAGCDDQRGGTPLVIELRHPVQSHGAAVRRLLGARFPCTTFVCNDRARTLYAVVSDRDAKALLGKHLAVRTVANAGGSVGRDATFMTITPKRFVPRELRPHAKALWFNTDPTFWLVDDPDDRACENAR